jgi:hypothetical protein
MSTRNGPKAANSRARFGRFTSRCASRFRLWYQVAKIPVVPGKATSFFARDGRFRPWLVGAAVYALCVLVFAVFASDRLLDHTRFNHFAHLANAWVHGTHAIANGGPAYALGNDFAEFNGKTYISFPPFPALLMLPLVRLAGSPEDFRDGQFIVWLAGGAPALLFMCLEKLRRLRRSLRTEQENLMLALLYAFGTVYFFSAVQGTVWFAGHVVGALMLALYILFSIGGSKPFWAGLALGCAFLTRPTMTLAGVLFLFELVRKQLPKTDNPDEAVEGDPAHNVEAPNFSAANVRRALGSAGLWKDIAAFALPLAACLGLAAWYNHARFQTWNPAAFGHEHLTVQWHSRIEKWGLFGYHYLGKNLGCMLTSLPWLPPGSLSKLARGQAIFQVNEHGLALWFTTPLFFWLFSKKRNVSPFTKVLALAAALPCVMNLLYQNSGWAQFGYRFSNDYSLTLFILLAVSLPRFGKRWWLAAAWAVGWNSFGAASFERAKFADYYFKDGTQSVVYQPD